MIRSVTFLIFLFLVISCKAQDSNLISYHEIPPYLLERNDMYYELPDSINVKSGFVALTIFIDESGRIKDFAINKMKVIKNIDAKELDFVSEDFKSKSKPKYTNEASFYYDVIKSYTENLEIVKNDQFSGTPEMSHVSFMVRFKDK